MSSASGFTPSSEVRNLVLRYYAAAASGDMEAFDRVHAREAALVFIGAGQTEWIADRARLIAIQAGLVAKRGGGLPWIPGEIHAYASGDAGWAVDSPRYRLASGAEIPCRFSFVLQREDAEWRIVHGHISIAEEVARSLGG